MTQEAFAAMSGIEHVRLMARNFGSVNEAFNQQFTYEQLFAVHRAWMLAEWDFFPSQWTARQVSEALEGKVPRWDENEKPIY